MDAGRREEGIMDDDIVGLRRELGEREIEVCEVCGRPVLREGMRVLPVDRGAGEPVEAVRICEGCGRALDAGDLPVDVETPSAPAEDEA